MNKLTFRILTAADEIDYFLESFDRFVKVKLPESYVQSGKVIGAFRNGVMMGGYMLITQGPFRSMAFVPDDVKHNLPMLQNAEAFDCVEVNGFWIHENYRRSRESTQIWLQLRKDLLATKASYLLLFYNAQAKGLAHLYKSIMKPRIIYQGAPLVNAGTTTSYKEVTVAIVSRREVRLSVYRGLGRILARTWPARAA